MKNKQQRLQLNQFELTGANMPTVALVSLFMVAAEVLFTAFVLILHSSRIERYIPNLISYALSIAMSLFVFSINRRGSKCSMKLVFGSQVAYLAYMTAWGLFITFLDYTGGGHITVFLAILLGVSALMFITFSTAIIYFPVATASLVAVLLIVNPDTGLAFIFNIINFNFAALFGSYIKYSHFTKEQEATRSLEYLSYHDNLTGLLNRNALERDTKAKLLGVKSFILMLDIDDFKTANDNLGHTQGDNILKQTSKLLSDTFGKDCCYRYGGDEFLVIVPSPPEGWKESLESSTSGCTLSGSYCTAVITDDDQHLIQVMDRALYVSKNSGKNRLQEVSPSSL
ncbi:MAG: GGDEF domain-containing protein [Sphaerochaetaceae bacterium]